MGIELDYELAFHKKVLGVTVVAGSSNDAPLTAQEEEIERRILPMGHGKTC